MYELSDALKCLCNSPHRLRILDALDSAQLDLRSLMTELDCPRTTVQRNLSVLEKRGWVKDTRAGYTATTAGTLIRKEVVTVDETIKTMTSVAPFLAAISTPAALDIDQLTDVHITEPAPARPNAPMKRLLDAFEGANRVRGCLPVVSWLLVERSNRATDDIISGHEYVISRTAFDALRTHAAEDGNLSEMNPPAHIDLYIYTDDLPYGLFISQDRLALTAYNANGRIQALVESTSETTIGWGERVYEHYRQQSKCPLETDVAGLSHSSGTAD
jgi:predicted transcriptional regulator